MVFHSFTSKFSKICSQEVEAIEPLEAAGDAEAGGAEEAPAGEDVAENAALLDDFEGAFIARNRRPSAAEGGRTSQKWQNFI